jgi:uncharacterized repeat protein (TIGR03803 family)
VGNVYGVASGGPHDYGIVFKLTQGRNGNWTEKVLYAFPGSSGGAFPEGGLVLDSVGNLYGASAFAVFELSPESNGVWSEKMLHTFVGGADGASPLATLILDKAGNLYGTTSTGGHHRGTVFELIGASNGVWTEKVLHRFASDGADGINPNFASLTRDAKGNLYGTTPLGGSSNAGVVFEVTP